MCILRHFECRKNAYNDIITGERRSILYWTGTAASVEQNVWYCSGKQILERNVNSPERLFPETLDTILLVYNGILKPLETLTQASSSKKGINYSWSVLHLNRIFITSYFFLPMSGSQGNKLAATGRRQSFVHRKVLLFLLSLIKEIFSFGRWEPQLMKTEENASLTNLTFNDFQLLFFSLHLPMKGVESVWASVLSFTWKPCPSGL